MNGATRGVAEPDCPGPSGVAVAGAAADSASVPSPADWVCRNP